MQLLSEATNDVANASPPQCAQAVLDVIPEVMWTLRLHMRQRRAKGLSVPQFRSLCLLRKFPDASVSMVADHLGSTLPTASRIVGGLVSRGILTRKSSSDDRRQVRLNLTTKGKSILDVARAGTMAAVAEKLEQLSVRDRTTLLAALSMMEQVLGRPSGADDRS